MSSTPLRAEGAASDGENVGIACADDARKISKGSASEGGKPTASAAKPRAEANPLASKLGLSPGAPRAAMPPQDRGRGRGGRGRGGRGPGGARGAKVVIPGRGGRPRYSPLMQASERNRLGRLRFVRASWFGAGSQRLPGLIAIDYVLVCIF